MPTFQTILVDSLLPPHNPQRDETLYANMDEFRANIHVHGLRQPIGVQVEGDKHRIIWGHKRSIAITQLKWDTIPAMVYEADEQIDHDEAMGAENYHRTNISEAEEARYYQRIFPRYPDGTIGMARELNVPQYRIENLLGLIQGDPHVFALLAERKLSMAQAMAINRFEHPGYKLQAIERATVEGISGATLDGWRRALKRQGIDLSAPVDTSAWDQTILQKPTEPMDDCNIGNHQVPLLERKIYSICHAHYNVFLEGLECLGKWRTIEEAGLLPKLMRLLREAEAEHGTSGRPSTD